MKKILFSDIDGTIANDNLPITYKDQEAVKKLRTQGHYFSFCTGRNIQETKLVTPHFEYDYLVLNNGAMIVDQNDQVLYRKQIKNEIAKEILKESYQKYPYLNYTFFDGQQTYGYINQKTCILTENGYQEIAGDFLEILDHTQDDIDIVCAFHPQEKLDEILEIQKQINQKYVGIHATLNVVYLDITVDCTKGSGLKKLCSLLNQEVISYCIGDSYNDLDMFEKADHAYTFNRVEKKIKEKTEKQVDYVYEVINDMLEGGITMSWQDKLRQVEPYVAGEQPKINNMIKLNTNENPYGPCKQIKDILKEIDIEKLKLYPNSDGEELRHALAKYHGLKDEQVFLGNGSDEVLALTFLTFFNGSDPVLFPNISYSFYPVYCDLYQMNYKEIILDQDFKMYVEDFKQPNSGIIFPNPNAPTGLLVSLDFIEEVLKSNPDSIVVVDEAYIDFGGQSCVPLIHQYENLVVIQTFSKSRSFAGARLGVALGNKEAISHLYDVKNSFNSYPIDYITQQIGLVSVLNSQDMKEKCQKVIQTREYTKTKLKELGFVVPDSYANFVFVKHPKIDGEELFLALRKEGIIVRHWNKPLIDQYLRVTIGTDQQMERFFEFLENYLNQKELL